MDAHAAVRGREAAVRNAHTVYADDRSVGIVPLEGEAVAPLPRPGHDALTNVLRQAERTVGEPAEEQSYLWVLRPTEVQLVYRTIDVFDPEGRFLGEIEPPSGFRPFPSPLIGEDFFMGVWVDEFDVESVRVYELQRHR